MTPDALPEGLVERCATKLKSLLPRNSLYEDEYEKLARAVLAVAAPALREQALREAREKIERLRRALEQAALDADMVQEMVKFIVETRDIRSGENMAGSIASIVRHTLSRPENAP